MNRNKLICLTLIPFLASCQGEPISVDAAKNIVKNISVELNENFSLNFITIIENGLINNNKFEKKVAFDFSKQFVHYYFYSNDNNQISENWTFVNKNSDGDKYIYYVDRNFEQAENPYNVERTVYSEEEWNLRKNTAYNQIKLIFFEKLNFVSKILNLSSFIQNFGLYSSNSKSLNVNADLKDVSNQFDNYQTFSADFNNSYLFKSSEKIDDKNYTNTKCEYDQFEVIYPNYEKK